MNIFQKLKKRYPTAAEFIVFFLISNGVTVLQLVLMPLLKNFFGMTNLVNTNFQVFPIGSNLDGSRYFIFDYMSGAIDSGGGGGLAYFLAVQITLLMAQIINFFLQRNVTFKSDTGIGKAALWYTLAYVIITLIAAAAQGLYKAPIYNLFMNIWNMGKVGETLADVLTMGINSVISFWVFFPIFKVIFKQKKDTPEFSAKVKA